MLRRSYLFEILCKRAQNRACSSSAECSQDYLKTMQEGRRSSPLGPHKAERKCLVEEVLQPKQPVFSWLVKVPLRGTWQGRVSGPSCVHLRCTCMVFRTKSGLRPALHLRCTGGIKGHFSESVNRDSHKRGMNYF